MIQGLLLCFLFVLPLTLNADDPSDARVAEGRPAAIEARCEVDSILIA